MFSLSGLFGTISPLLLVVAIISHDPLKLFFNELSERFFFSIRLSVEFRRWIFSFSRIDWVLFAALSFAVKVNV